ncbi:MAG: hypothetical protein J6K55_09495 [Clostridia bacterium]|nr:hypothetical protein [Clostridia bacterium]
MCNRHWSKHVRTAVLCLGIVSFLFGLLSFLIGKPEGHSLNTLLGMFTGFGAGIMGVAIWGMIREKVVSREKLEQEKIELQDERSIAIMRAAGLAAFYAAIAIFAVLIFLFMGLGYTVPSYICLGAMYLMVAVAWIARKVFEKKM